MSCRLLPHGWSATPIFFWGALNFSSSSQHPSFFFLTFYLFTECSQLFDTRFTSLLCRCIRPDTSSHIKMQRALTSRAATSVLSPSVASRFRASGALSQQLRFAHKVRWLEWTILRHVRHTRCGAGKLTLDINRSSSSALRAALLCWLVSTPLQRLLLQLLVPRAGMS